MSKNNKNAFGSIRGLFRANSVFLRELCHSGRRYILFQVFACVALIPINYWTVYAPKYFIDSVIRDKKIYPALLWIALTIVLKYLDRGMLFAQDYLRKHAFSEAKLKAKQVLYKKFQLMYLTYFEDPHNLDVFNRALSYNETGGEKLLNSIIGLIRAVVTLGTMTYISIQFEWWIWFAIVIVVLFEYYSDKYLKQLGFSFSMEKIKRDREQNYYNGLPTNKGCIADIKLNSNVDFFFDKYKSAYLKNRDISEKYDFRVNILSYLFAVPSELFFFLCYFLIGHRLINGSSSLGDYSLFFSITTSLTTQLKVIIRSINHFHEQSLEAKVYNDFVDNTKTFIQHSLSSGEKIEKIRSIVLNNISFTYPGRHEKAISDLSVTIRRGEKISVVGLNGAGKTTFVKLLTMLFAPDSGSISINGIDSRNINAYEYWQKIGVVFQDHREYAMSIKDNVLLRNSNSEDDSLVWDALHRVGLAEKIKYTNQGIDLQLTRVFDPQGLDFSGGEKQRLAIAKVLAKKPDVYILDEPSSALDPRGEDELYRCIREIPSDKTVVLISHRLSCVAYTDRVLFFDNGCIIADGTHDNLIETCEPYRQIYRLQADKYM